MTYKNNYLVCSCGGMAYWNSYFQDHICEKCKSRVKDIDIPVANILLVNYLINNYKQKIATCEKEIDCFHKSHNGELILAANSLERKNEQDMIILAALEMLYKTL